MVTAWPQGREGGRWHGGGTDNGLVTSERVKGVRDAEVKRFWEVRPEGRRLGYWWCPIMHDVILVL